MKLIDADAYLDSIKPRGISDELWKECKEYKSITAFPAIEISPVIDPQPYWVPCSERLPEEYGNYLITTYDGDVDIGSIDPSRKGVWSACDADGFYWLRNVIAWMPLPERYQEGANE